MATSRFSLSGWLLGTLVSQGGKDTGILHVVNDDGTGTASPGPSAAQVGAVDETAPASDTASSGLNGRLQRTAQNLTTANAVLGTTAGAAVVTDANGTIQQYLRGIIVKLIAQFPAALGAQTSAASLSVTLASNALPPIGGAYTDRSIANLAGSSEQLMAANAARRIIIVHNIGATAVALNLAGGTASLTVAGNIVLAAAGSLILDAYPPVGVVTVIGTATADLTAYEG